MPKVGLVLSGCGYLDGSEIQETVITLLALDRHGATVLCMAPNIDQMHVIDHTTGEPMSGEKRNVLLEAARIVRGQIKDIKDVSANDFDALIFPGGYGAAQNLSDFAVKGGDCSVNQDVERLIKETLEAHKPLGMICISPVVISKIHKGSSKKLKLTIGTDKDTANALIGMGTDHIDCPVKEHVVDKENKIVSSPAYMFGQSRISEVAEGIEKTVQEVLGLI